MNHQGNGHHVGTFNPVDPQQEPVYHHPQNPNYQQQVPQHQVPQQVAFAPGFVHQQHHLGGNQFHQGQVAQQLLHHQNQCPPLTAPLQQAHLQEDQNLQAAFLPLDGIQVDESSPSPSDSQQSEVSTAKHSKVLSNRSNRQQRPGGHRNSHSNDSSPSMARHSTKKRTTKNSSKAVSAAAGTNSSPSSKENDVTIAQLEARLDDLTKQHQDLQAKHSASEQYMTDELVVNGKPKLNEAMKVKIHKVIKDLFFRSYKFVLSDKQMATVFQKILPFVFEKPLDEIPAKARQEFCVKYNDWVKFCFGERRAYVQQQLKLVAMDFREEHGKMPTLEMFCKCAKREIDFQNEEEMAAMEWYWLKVLGTVGGYTGWGDKAKFYNTPVSMTYISKAHNPNQSYKLFPATTEAFMVVMYDNCVEKWEAMALWKEQNGAKTKLPRKSNKNKDEPIHKTKYTVSDKGQIKWAGWLDIGLQRFQELRTEIIASRAETIEIPADDDADDDTTVDAENEQDVPMTTVNRIEHFETKFLEYLKTKHNKPEISAMEDKKAKRRKVQPDIIHDFLFDDE